jgi:hypothetical protein
MERSRDDPVTLIKLDVQFGSKVYAIYWSSFGEVFRDLHGSSAQLTLQQMNWMRDQAAE